MVTGKGKLVIDLGNSSTRVGVQFGRDAKLGTPKTQIRTISNGYSAIQEESIPILTASGNYTADTSRIFKFSHEGAEGYYCNGEICDREFGIATTRPTALQKKYRSVESMKAIINSICQGNMMVADMNGAEYDDVNVTWDVFILLPPGHIEEKTTLPDGTETSGAGYIAHQIKSVKSLDFQLPKLKMDISINSVTVFPEGHCAFMAVLFEHKNQVRDGYKYLAKSVSLVIDIGAGTSDICVIENGKTLINTRFTTEIGGNNIHKKVGNMLKAEGIKLYDSDVREGVVKGYVHDGAKRVSIVKKIALAKQQVANQLVQEIQSFFEDTGYLPQRIANLLVVGGGAELSENEKIVPMSKYITHFMKSLSPNIEDIPYPVEVVDGERKTIPPRLLNIYGAMILAE